MIIPPIVSKSYSVLFNIYYMETNIAKQQNNYRKASFSYKIRIFTESVFMKL